MNLEDFANLHLPALGADEVKFNVQVAALNGAVKAPTAGFAYWSLGVPGHCALRSPGRAICWATSTRPSAIGSRR